MALEQHLRDLADKVENDSAPAPHRQAHTKRRRKAGSHSPQFDLARELQRISGVDLTRINGIDVSVAQTVISEVGLDMSRWPDEHHFAFVARTVSRQSDHGRQSDPSRHPARRQSRRHRSPHRGHDPASQPRMGFWRGGKRNVSRPLRPCAGRCRIVRHRS
jgi:hypothetical protein